MSRYSKITLGGTNSSPIISYCDIYILKNRYKYLIIIDIKTNFYVFFLTVICLIIIIFVILKNIYLISIGCLLTVQLIKL